MLRGFSRMCGNRNFFLEPYVSSYQLFNHYTTAKPNVNLQNLPSLPVPKLEDTLKKYLRTVKPYLNDEEFALTTSIVKDFASEGGVGRKLQGLLERRSQHHLNWLEEWWLSTAYLGYRDPVVVFSSPGLVFPFRNFKSQKDQLKYAAKTLLAAVDYKHLIDNDKIPVEMMGKSPLDMGQYKKIFGTCRIPWEKQDKLSYNDSKYITVIHNNHIFHVDLWGEDNILLNEDQIIEQLEYVIKQSATPTNQGIGILTSENRDTWAKAYQLLIKGKFIVGADGVTGLTYEHSPAEGQPIAVMTDFIVNYIDRSNEKKNPSAKPKLPKLLQFNVNSDVKEMIKGAQKNLDKLVADLELNCFQYDKYGKNFIKSQKLSPDSYLQMAMQLAFYRLHKTPGAHYESAATRMYVGGRTETIRSCSIESIEFAKTMLNPNSSPKEKLTTLQNAIKGHKDYTVQALQGFGVDRHLLGLKLIALENGIDLPKIYSDPGFTRSAHMRISTSQVACKCDGFMCYGPLVADGYATCYNPRDNDVNFATAAFVAHPDTSCDKYRKALEDSLQDMHDLLLRTTRSKL